MRSPGRPKEFHLKRILLFLHYLSLDVAIGAVAGSAFASRALTSPSRRWLLVVLFLTVYGIYSLDHAMDAAGSANVTDPRRSFHRRHRRFLWVSSVAALAAAGVVAVYFLRAEVLWAGVALGVFMSVYLAGIYLRIPTAWKELFTAAGYTAGIWLPHVMLVWPLRPDQYPLLVLPLLLFLATLLNLYAYALLDSDTDRMMGQTSVAQHRSLAFTRALIHALVLAGGLSLGGAVFLRLPTGLILTSGAHLAVQYALSLRTVQEHAGGAVRTIGEYSYWIFFAGASVG